MGIWSSVIIRKARSRTTRLKTFFSRGYSPTARSDDRQGSMSPSLDFDSCLFEAVAAASEAGDEIKAAWFVERDVEYKGECDLVTATDKKCEDLIFRRLQAAFPEHDFVGEESVAAANGVLPTIGDAPTWFVDPLDGTTNFVHGYPFSCVSIGLTVHKIPVLGVVLNPITGETFAAVQGRGATLNGERISVSSVTDLNKSLVATEIGVGRDAETVDAIMSRVRVCVETCRSLRASGSCAMNMCGVAAGRLDAFFEIGFGGPWDCVGAAVIVREAGGLVMDPHGGAFQITGRRVLCGNPQVATKLAKVLAAVPDGPLEPHAPAR